MELNFKIKLNVKLTEDGYKRAIEIHKTDENIINNFKIGLKELILDELKPDINTGMVEINIDVISC